MKIFNYELSNDEKELKKWYKRLSFVNYVNLNSLYCHIHANEMNLRQKIIYRLLKIIKWCKNKLRR